jgi:hypothetical protein
MQLIDNKVQSYRCFYHIKWHCFQKKYAKGLVRKYILTFSCCPLLCKVADFDFNNSEDEELQYKTFWERLRESFGTLLQCENCPNVQLASGRATRSRVQVSLDIPEQKILILGVVCWRPFWCGHFISLYFFYSTSPGTPRLFSSHSLQSQELWYCKFFNHKITH